MKIFGFNISREKAMQPVNDWRHGWRVIHEPYTGAWQKNDELKRGDLACYPALFACLSLISEDIGTMPLVLKRIGDDGIWREDASNTSYWPVLRKPNGYQTDQQFREQWVLSLLMDGNTYVLKERDNRGVVTKLYIMDPCRVTPMVSDMGRVFYKIQYNSNQNLLPEHYGADELVVPATEVIHHRINCLHHPLIGVPPLCAAALAAGKNFRIIRNSSAFFENSANPGGLVSGPAGLTGEDADKLQEFFNANFTGEKSGKIAVVGADLKFTPFSFKAADSQLVEQLQYSDRQICQPFKVPPYMVGIGEIPAGMKVDEVRTDYYQRALRPIVEGMERLLDEGLGVSRPLGIELDESALLRMDLGKMADVESKLVGGKIKTPDEARAVFGLAATGGGNTLWGQNQDYPLGMLANRNEWDPDMAPAPPPVLADDEDEADADAIREFLDGVERDLIEEEDDDWAGGLFSRSPIDFVKGLAATVH